MSKTVVCRGCGWASYAVTQAWAERQIEKFNAYFDALPKDEQEMFRGRSSLDSYRCLSCQGTAFRVELPEDRIPKYATLNPVVCDELADDPSDEPPRKGQTYDA